MILQSLFDEAVAKGASDIHIKEGEQIVIRVHGDLIPSDTKVLPDKITMFDFLYTLLYGKKERISYYKRNMEIDFGYVHKDGASYRGNAYMYMGRMGIAIRKIPEEIKNLIELGLPKSLSKVLQAKQGLFLVTGPTGSGKSTTMASMIEAINEFRSEHVITIEDPIEYIFHNKKSIISQREVGRDTASFRNAIRSAMREDADVIMIGEIRDAETMDIALSLAETGHLVFSTLHTSGSVQTLSRIIQFFPSEIENQIRTRIADSLVGALAQRLIPRVDTTGRVAIREIMYVTSGIRNLIAKWEFQQIPTAIETGTEEGMITMKKYADTLRDKWVIEEKDYKGYFVNDTNSYV